IFDGMADDVIVIEMNSAESRDIFSPQMSLLGPSGAPLAQTPDNPNTVYFTVLSYVLPSDGTYTIQAAQGQFGDDTGDYTIRLLQPEALIAGETIEETINADTGNQYYVVESDGASTVDFRMIGAEEQVPRFVIREAETFRLQAYYLSFTPVSTGSITGFIEGGGPLLVSAEYDAGDLYAEFLQPAGAFQITLQEE
ncbi:MAG: hypothetical protein AAF125_22390, partial [Chloroflexota bacterium]